MKDTLTGCAVIVIGLLLVVALSIGGLVWGGVIKVGNTIIDRQVNIHSQQYITTHNDHILSLIRDFNAVDPSAANSSGRRISIQNQICAESVEIDAGERTTPVQDFYLTHCN